MASKYSHLQNGFTLIEMLVVVFLTSVILLGLFSLYEWHGKMYSYQQAVVRVTQSSRNTMQTLSTYVSQSYQVATSTVVQGVTYTSDADSLVLFLPSIDSTGNVVAGKTDTAVFYSSGTDAFVSFQPDVASSRTAIAKKQLSDSLQSLTFTYNNASTTQVTQVTAAVTNRVQVRTQLVKSAITEGFYLKNY